MTSLVGTFPHNVEEVDFCISRMKVIKNYLVFYTLVPFRFELATYNFEACTLTTMPPLACLYWPSQIEFSKFDRLKKWRFSKTVFETVLALALSLSNLWRKKILTYIRLRYPLTDKSEYETADLWSMRYKFVGETSKFDKLI